MRVEKEGKSKKKKQVKSENGPGKITGGKKMIPPGFEPGTFSVLD